jgi:quercetin dioxygenase-like cupin family protein
MKIDLAGSRPTRRAPSEHFTGTVWQDPIIQAEAPARIVAARVAFEPGARTNWHIHPLGQTLYVLSGIGRFQTKGGSGPAMSSGFHRTKNIGMAAPQPTA